MVEDLHLEPLDSELVEQPLPLKDRDKAASMLYADNYQKDGSFAMADDASSISSSASREAMVPYHWGWRARQAILQEAVEYEAAYAALVDGRFTECRRILASAWPDKAWEMLATQLEQQIGSSERWEGVLHFPEK
eukprot:GGOE01011769.1.p1 GENE.GGOE01011769.1~~GGOE01011769.1.p1  ORF type:complete len:135 (-),score=41.86 GGOE01011769.1:982-1386(-)